MLLKNIYPFIRQALINSMSFKTKNDVFIKLQSSDCRLFYIVSGSGNMIIENNSYKLIPGCVILFQSGTKYMWQTSKEDICKYISINFDYTHNFAHLKKSFHPMHSDLFTHDNILETITFSDVTQLNAPIVLYNLQTIESRLRTILTEFYINGKYCDELLSSLLKSVIINILQEIKLGDNNTSVQGLVMTKKIMQFIQNNYQKEITYDTIEENFHLNPIYLNRIFKKHAGTSLHAFIANYRISIAMELLRSSNAFIKEIASMVGFCDVYHFSKSFKKVTGKTPADYRNSSKS